MKKNKIKKADIVFALMIGMVVIFFWLCHWKAKNGSIVRITENGITTEYSLEKDREIHLKNNKTGGVNKIIIQDGKVYMEEASCKDQICVRHREIWKNREMIVCLPNSVFVEIVGGEEADIDN